LIELILASFSTNAVCRLLAVAIQAARLSPSHANGKGVATAAENAKQLETQGTDEPRATEEHGKDPRHDPEGRRSELPRAIFRRYDVFHSARLQSAKAFFSFI